MSPCIRNQVAYYDARKHACEAIAKRFCVSLGMVKKLIQQHKAIGEIGSREIKNVQFVVGSDKVAAPRQLRFMWDQTCEGNLYNEACLLPGAFRIQAAK